MAAGAVAELPAGFKLDAPGAGGANLPAGFTLDAPTSKPPDKPASAQPAPTSQPQEGDWSGTNFVTGNLAKGVTGLAGLPVDTATNLTNLGIAGYGAARGALTGRPGESPQPIDPSRVPMSSGWMQDMLRRGGGLRDAEPESMGGRYAASALQALPGMAMGRPGIPQVPRAASAAVTSGLAGQAGADVGGEEYRGAASMLPGFRSMQTKPPGERATQDRTAERFGQAKEMGIPVPPRLLKPDNPQQRAQNEANMHLGNPEGAPITPESLKAYRKAFVADYEAPFKSGLLGKTLQPTPEFQAQIQQLGEQVAGGTSSMPQTFKGVKEATKLLQEYGYAQLPGNAQGGRIPPRSPLPTANVQRAIRIMREGATANYQTGGESNVALARTQRGIADALESLVEKNLVAHPEAMAKFRDARTAMAKAGDIELSLDPKTSRVDGTKLAQMMNDGRPISGRLREFAQVARDFPQAVQSPPNTAASNEMFTRRVSPLAVTHPGAAAAHWATKFTDPITTSRPYQSMIDPRRRLSPEQERMVRMFLATQRQGEIPAPPQ